MPRLTEKTLAGLEKDFNASEFRTVAGYSLKPNGSSEINIEQLTKNGYLILNESYYPGWYAITDTNKLEIEEINGLRAIKLAEGTAGNINIVYRPKSAIYGLYATIAGILIWLFLYFREIKIFTRFNNEKNNTLKTEERKKDEGKTG